jgi:hypothetical protein
MMAFDVGPSVGTARAVVVACSESVGSRRIVERLRPSHALYNFGAVLPFDAELDPAGMAAIENAVACGARRILLVGHAGCRLHRPTSEPVALASRHWRRVHAVPRGARPDVDAPLDRLHVLWQLARFEASPFAATLADAGVRPVGMWLDEARHEAFEWRKDVDLFVPIRDVEAWFGTLGEALPTR